VKLEHITRESRICVSASLPIRNPQSAARLSGSTELAEVSPKSIRN